METEKRRVGDREGKEKRGRVRDGERLNSNVSKAELEPGVERRQVRVVIQAETEIDTKRTESPKEDTVVERGVGAGRRGPALTCFLLGQPQALICVTADCVRYHSCPHGGILPKKGRPGRSIHCTQAMAEWDPTSGCRTLEPVVRTGLWSGLSRSRIGPGTLPRGHLPAERGPSAPLGLLVPCPSGMLPGAQLTCFGLFQQQEQPVFRKGPARG